jgi:PAS domain S-box-containing protein
VTEQQAAEREVLTQTALLDELDVAVVATDPEGRITHWNRGAEDLYGWTRAEALGESAESRDGGQPVLGAQGQALDSHVRLRRKDGTAFPAHVRCSPIMDGRGGVVGSIAVSLDESPQVAAKGYLDAVTDSMGEGLFAVDADGRVTLMNRAAEAMLGWPLEEIKGLPLHEITHYRREDGSVFPLDECPILAARTRAVTVRVAEDMFVTRDGSGLPVSYTSAPLRTADGQEGCVVVFQDATQVRAEQRRLRDAVEELSSIHRVEEALRENRFVLHAQPIVDIRTGEVTQHELLLRVREQDGSVAGPGPYLTAAEEHGLIGTIDRWVIGQGLAIAAQGHAVELNISAASVSDPALLVDLERLLADSGADPALLVFEITETTLISDEAAGRTFVTRLHELGCQVALDDFGTGYGGFTYLKHLPLDYLKIDIEFVGDLLVNRASRHVVEAIVTLAEGFELRTVAEGVEDAETLELLARLGVGLAQGFHLGRPAPLADTLLVPSVPPPTSVTSVTSLTSVTSATRLTTKGDLS